MKHIVKILISFFLVAQVSTVAFAEKGSINLKNEAFKETEVVNDKGEKEYKLVDLSTALPGDTVLYITTFKNIGQQPANGIVINNPISKNLTYKADTAFGAGTTITYSVDGKKFDVADKLKVKDENGKKRTATAKDYTAIRWVYEPDLQPGDEATVTFKATIKK